MAWKWSWLILTMLSYPPPNSTFLYTRHIHTYWWWLHQACGSDPLGPHALESALLADINWVTSKISNVVQSTPGHSTLTTMLRNGDEYTGDCSVLPACKHSWSSNSTVCFPPPLLTTNLVHTIRIHPQSKSHPWSQGTWSNFTWLEQNAHMNPKLSPSWHAICCARRTPTQPCIGRPTFTNVVLRNSLSRANNSPRWDCTPPRLGPHFMKHTSLLHELLVETTLDCNCA